MGTWIWTVCGKHPTVNDYFSTCGSSPLAGGFSDWMVRGYEAIVSRKRSSMSDFPPLSYRFWAAGPGSETLLCGVIRDSNDTIGRPYPLMVLGIGPLGDWQSHWHCVPFACEKTWSHMESVAARPHRDLKHLDDEIRRIRPPQPEWPIFQRINQDLYDQARCREAPDWPADFKEHADKLLAASEDKGEGIFIPISEKPPLDFLSVIQLWHSALKTHFSELPKAVFMGGAPHRTFLAVFSHRLGSDAFVRLWSLGPERG
jgi:type VI secretion system protein VasJ